MSAETARIWAKNIALGLPAHGMPFTHRTVEEIAERYAPLRAAVVTSLQNERELAARPSQRVEGAR